MTKFFKRLLSIPQSINRVESRSSQEINARLQRMAECSINEHASRGPKAITQRLEELDREWDIERALQTNAATLTLSGIILGSLANRKWLILPGVVTGFLVQHAIQGWCPPLPILRRLGYRTQHEIDNERFALKLLRGDFDEALPAKKKGDNKMSTEDVRKLLQTVREPQGAAQ